jgi:hypothetical protein
MVTAGSVPPSISIACTACARSDAPTLEGLKPSGPASAAIPLELLVEPALLDAPDPLLPLSEPELLDVPTPPVPVEPELLDAWPPVPDDEPLPGGPQIPAWQTPPGPSGGRQSMSSTHCAEQMPLWHTRPASPQLELSWHGVPAAGGGKQTW